MMPTAKVARGARPVVYEAAQGRSAEEIKELQKELGVTTDGKWGPKTQAAYEAYANRNKEAAAQEDYSKYPVWDSGGDQRADTSAYNEGLAAKAVRVPSEQELMIAKILGGDTRTAAKLFE